MFVFKAAVVGAGVMGGEIAQVIASADIPVLLKDVNQEFVDKGLEKAREVTQGQTAKLVKREKLTQEQADAQLEHTLGLITGTTEYDGFGDVDFVIEAVPEKMAIKHQVFADLDAVTPGHAILASLARDGEGARTLTAFLALAGAGFSAWLIYVEVAELRAICAWCVGSALCMTALAGLSVARALRGPA